MMKLSVRPAPGLKVRAEDGLSQLKDEAQTVPASTYYRRRLAAGDLVAVDDTPLSPREQLIEAVRALDPGNVDHFTEGGKPSLNHLTDTLGRRITRAEVDEALAAIAGA